MSEMKNDPQAEICIDGDLTIAGLAPLRERLLAELAGDRDCQLNVSNVARVDTLGLQLLVSAIFTAARAGRTWKVTGETETFRSSMDALGLCPSTLGLSPRHS